MFFVFVLHSRCHAYFNEWYIGIQGGLSSLTGKHHYSNAGEGDKENNNNNQRARENLNNNNSNSSDNNKQKTVTQNQNQIISDYTRLVEKSKELNRTYDYYRDISKLLNNPPVTPSKIVGNPPPPPPPPPAQGGNIQQEVPNNLHLKLNNPQAQIQEVENGRNRENVNHVFFGPPIEPISHSGNGMSHKYGDISLNERSHLLGVHLGYLRNFDSYKKLIVGLETYFNFNNLKIDKDLKVDDRHSEGKITIAHPYNIGFSLLGGFLFDPKTFIYGRIGVESNKFILTYDNLNFVGARLPYNCYPLKERYNFSLRGIVPGCGIRIWITPKISSSLEYTYSMMQKKHLRLDTLNINSVNRGYLFSPNQHRILLKLSYNLSKI